MTVPAHIVGLWATLNLALTLVLPVYDEWSFALVLHLLASGVVAVFGIAVLVAIRRRGIGPELRLPYRSVAALATGALGLVVALAVVWGWWVLVLAPYPLVVVLLTLRSERVPAGADTGPLRTPRPVPVDRPPTTREVRAEALENAHARKRARRGEAT
jgi:lysylphosphatidylglycerol synthetase-like protein (DUF2156 family)